MTFDETGRLAHITVGLPLVAAAALCGAPAVRFGLTLRPFDREHWPTPPQPWCSTCLTVFDPPALGDSASLAAG
jgi:hypothetical protein